MTSLMIFLTVFGLVMIIISFFLSGSNKKENSNSDEIIVKQLNFPLELSEDDKARISSQVDNAISGRLNEIMDMAEERLATLSNEKIMAVNEYSDTVLNEIEKNHSEVMFLYSMLNDKEKDLKSFTSKNLNTSKLDYNQRNFNKPIENTQNIESNINNLKEKEDDASSELWGIFGNESQDAETLAENNNKKILELHNQGLDALAIAKQLNLGIGEVKLVLDLFK